MKKRSKGDPLSWNEREGQEKAGRARQHGPDKPHWPNSSRLGQKPVACSLSFSLCAPRHLRLAPLARCWTLALHHRLMCSSSPGGPEKIDIGTGKGPEFSNAAPTKGLSIVEWLTRQKKVLARTHQDLGPEPGRAAAVTVQGEPEASGAGEQGCRQEVHLPSPAKHYRSTTAAQLSHITTRPHSCMAAASAPDAAAPARIRARNQGGRPKVARRHRCRWPPGARVCSPQFASSVEFRQRRDPKRCLPQCTSV
ncbi:hypothetical protein NDU88_006646 [Pleurodeles waltl]|uniref:Uncharacterized protein n=1 Tax=Pleurodeles waltl TaxID=8319 RepID=A0AAV7X4C8_PLEWA|nr:hypothetical protein NDU88_006646 [Pleurodeles waltl]